MAVDGTSLFLACGASFLFGFAANTLVERFQHYRLSVRERAFYALGGEVPDWELRARSLEDQADRREIDGNGSLASSDRAEAQRTRRVARRRLRQGRPALP